MRIDPEGPLKRSVTTCRWVYCWVFLSFSPIAIYVYAGKLVHDLRTHPVDRADLFSSTVLGLYAVVYGTAGLMIVRGKPALRRWAIAANLILIFFWAPVLVSGNWRGFFQAERQWWPVILFGLFGVVIFSLPQDGPAALTLQSFCRFAAKCYIVMFVLMFAGWIAASLNVTHFSLRISFGWIAALCSVLFIPFWIGMIWDCLFRSRLSPLATTLWMLVIVPFFYVGMLVYYFVVFARRQRKVPSDDLLIPQ